LRCSGAGDAIWKDSSGYTYKTIARKVIVVMAEPGNLRLSASGDSGAHGSEWDKMHVEELMKWIPDEDEHLEPLSSMMGGEIRNLFGMSPPWISYFTCYMGVLKKGQIDVLQKSSSLDVLNVIERLQSKGVSPSIESDIKGAGLLQHPLRQHAHVACEARNPWCRTTSASPHPSLSLMV
jgi:hypothetical protein